MDKERRDIIVKEINHWKAHQLLPQQYCDFLLALYTEGEGNEEVEKEQKKSPFYLLFYFFNTLLILFPILIIQIFDYVWFQAIAIIIVLSIATLMIKLFSRHELLNESYAIMILLLSFLLTIVSYINEYTQIWWLNYLWVLLNSVVWIVYGSWKQQFFVKVAGVFILILLGIMFGFQLF